VHGPHDVFALIQLMTDELDALKAEIDAILEPVKDLPDDDPRKIAARAKVKPLAEKALAILKEREPRLFERPRPRPRGCCSMHPGHGHNWPIRIRVHPNEQDLERMRAARSVPDEE
jgi:hypothetical protein